MAKKIKQMHGLLSPMDFSEIHKENMGKLKADLQNYFQSKNFNAQTYVDLMSGKYHDNFFGSDLKGAADLLRGHPHNNPVNNDRVVSSILKDLKNDENQDDAYWHKDRLENAVEHLHVSPEKLHDIIDNYQSIPKDTLSDIHENPAFNREHLASIINKPTIPISNEMAQHPAMDQQLFDKMMAKKKHNYDNLPGAFYESPFFNAEHAKKVLETPSGMSDGPMDTILEKLSPEQRHSHLNDVLGMTGGKPSQDIDDMGSYRHDDDPAIAKENHGWDNWSHGEKHDPQMAENAASSKHLSPDQIDFIKRHGDFKQKFALFNNKDIDPKHAIDMLQKWQNDDTHHGYDSDDIQSALKKEKEDEKWEDFHEEAREAAEEENPWEDFISNYDDDDLSNAYFEMPYDEWKAQWAGRHKPSIVRNPDYDPSLPEDDTNSKTLDYSANMEDHPDFDQWDDEAKEAFKAQMDAAETPDRLHEGYDEYLRDDQDREMDKLFDHEVDNWHSSDYLLPKHLTEAIKKPWQSENITPEQLEEGLNHPLKMARETAAANENVSPEQISRVLSGHDNDGEGFSDAMKKAVLDNKKNLRPEHLDQALSGDDSDIAAHALKNSRVSPEQISKALEHFSGDSTVVPAALAHPAATDEHARKVLQDARQELDGGVHRLNPRIAGVKEALDSKFNLTPEELKEAFDTGDTDTAALAVKHPNVTPDMVNAALSHRSSKVKKAGEHVQQRKFPPTSDAIHLKLGTHPLRQLRDFVAQNGGVMTKAKMKSLGANPAPIEKLFTGKGTIAADDIQKFIDTMPGTQYNTSHGHWAGGQRHSDKPQDVFQLNYTQDQLNRMEKEGVLPTFQKIHEASFRSGHPVRPNSLGWVRYTGGPETGFHVDEVQSDFGQSMIKRVAAQAKEALRSGAISEDAAQDAVSRAKEYYPEEHVEKINEILFGKKHPSEVLHEGFKEYMRQKGFGDTPIHIWKPESKAPISGQSTHAQISPEHVQDMVNEAKTGQVSAEAKALIGWAQKQKIVPASYKEITPEHLDAIPAAYISHVNARVAQHAGGGLPEGEDPIPKLPVPLPVHMQEGYGAIPKKMKYSEGNYGELPTQENAEYKGQPTYKDIIRKSEVDASTRTKIAITLKAIKDNASVWKQLEQSNPQAYQSLMGLVQSLVELFKKKTAEDPQALVHELEIQQQLEEQQAQMQGQPGQEGQAPQPGQPSQPGQDEPIHRRQMVYAPGSERTYSPQDKRIKDQDGNWSAFKGGLQDPDGGQNG